MKKPSGSNGRRTTIKNKRAPRQSSSQFAIARPKPLCDKDDCRLVHGEKYPIEEIIDCDVHCKTNVWDGPISDYLILMKTTSRDLVVLEMTTGLKSADHVREQISGGVELAKSVWHGRLGKRLFPVFVHTRMKPFEFTVLKEKCRINYQNRSMRIILAKCGDDLDDIIEKFG